MDWDAISAVGELVGATAVVISIIYLALQVRQNSSHVRSSRYQTAAQSANQMFDSWSTHPETLKIFQVAQESYDSLNESDQLVARTLFLQVFVYYEALYYQYEDRVVDSDIWEGRKRMMLNLLQMPGVASWWGTWRPIFGARFQAHVTQGMKSPGDLYLPF